MDHFVVELNHSTQVHPYPCQMEAFIAAIEAALAMHGYPQIKLMTESQRSFAYDRALKHEIMLRYRESTRQNTRKQRSAISRDLYQI